MSQQFTEAIHRYIYLSLQDFVQIQLREPLRKTVKHKRQVIKRCITVYTISQSCLQANSVVFSIFYTSALGFGVAASSSRFETFVPTG